MFRRAGLLGVSPDLTNHADASAFGGHTTRKKAARVCRAEAFHCESRSLTGTSADVSNPTGAGRINRALRLIASA